MNMPIYQINQDDLSELERLVPSLCESLSVDVQNDRCIRVQLRKVQAILSRVRWDRVTGTNAVGKIQTVAGSTEMAGDAEHENV